MRLPSPPRSLAVGALALTLALAAACGGSSTSGGSGGLTAGGLDPVEADAPTGAVSGLTFERFDGTSGSFADYSGQDLVVNFFASWCVPCITEMPDFETVHQQLGDRVTFVGVNVQDQLADGQAIATKTGVTYDLVRDPRGELLRAFGGRVMPTTAFVDAEGTVVQVASKKLSAAELTEEIEKSFP